MQGSSAPRKPKSGLGPPSEGAVPKKRRTSSRRHSCIDPDISATSLLVEPQTPPSRRSRTTKATDPAPPAPSDPPHLGYPTPPASVQKCRRETFVLKTSAGLTENKWGSRPRLKEPEPVPFSPTLFFKGVDELRARDLQNSADRSSEKQQNLVPSKDHPTIDPPLIIRTSPTKTSMLHSIATVPLPNQILKSDLLAELEAISQELDRMVMLDSPEPSQQGELDHVDVAGPQTNPCRSSTPRRSSSSSRPAKKSRSPPKDALAELMAVAEELNGMQRLDSIDLLTRSTPAQNRQSLQRRRREAAIDGLPPSIVSALDSSFLEMDSDDVSRHILEYMVYEQSFNGVEVPSILVTQADESLGSLPQEGNSMPAEGLLAPPMTDGRGRVGPPAATWEVECLLSAFDSESSDSFVCVNQQDATPDDSVFVRCECQECNPPSPEPQETSSPKQDLSWLDHALAVGPRESFIVVPRRNRSKPELPTAPKPPSLLKRASVQNQGSPPDSPRSLLVRPRRRSFIQRVFKCTGPPDSPRPSVDRQARGEKRRSLKAVMRSDSKKRHVDKESIGSPKRLTGSTRRSSAPSYF